LARLELRNLSGMGHEAAIRHNERIGDLRIEMVKAALREVMSDHVIDAWMRSPNREFGGRSPEDVARADPARLMEMVRRLGSGEPG